MESAIAYYRVSTRQQQRSALGIEAQRATVARFAEAEGLTVTPSSSRRKPEKAPKPSTGGRSSLPRWPLPRSPNAAVMIYIAFLVITAAVLYSRSGGS